MHLLNTHQLPMKPARDSAEAGMHLSHLLAATKISAIGKWRRPAWIGGLHMGAFSFVLVDSRTPMGLEASANAEYFVMLSCLQGAADMTIDGRAVQLGTGQGFLARPCERITGQFSDDCVRLIVRVYSKVLDDGAYPDPERFDIATPSMQPLFEQVQLLLSSAPLMRAVASNPTLFTRMEKLLLALVESSRVPFSQSSRRTSVTSGDVFRAEAYIRNHAHEKISLGDIALASGASSRTLQNNFMKYRNKTPIQYLRDIRLDCAREKLLLGRALVADVAFESGFWHQGRFASSYRDRFGETPSATLIRAERYGLADERTGPNMRN